MSDATSVVIPAHPHVGAELLGHVGVVELRRPPHNYLDSELISQLADVCEALDNEPACRVIVLCAQGRAFSAGADQSRPRVAAVGGGPSPAVPHLYTEALRLFRIRKPIIGAVEGAAVGGGLGLALVADFRITCPKARYWANFTRLGFHAGFGLTVTLPRLIGSQCAASLFYTGRRVHGEEAVEIGLADILVPDDQVRERALVLASEIAECAPLAVISMRHTLRRGLLDQIEAATERELVEQNRLRQTADYQEGVRAMAERRPPVFVGR
jgi:enoyl-CoA hydratase/carnithine racemase